MVTEKSFERYIDGKLGLKLGKDYGFIVGTIHPFGAVSGMFSSDNKKGFEVWRKFPNGDIFYKNFIDHHISGVIDFLSGDVEPDKKTSLTGESEDVQIK